MSGKIRFLGLVALVGLVGASVFLNTPGLAQKKPPAPPADPAIAYVAEKAWGHTNLMVMNADGSNQKILINGITGAGYGNHDPNWSPDCNWIVFGRTDGGIAPKENGIYKIKKDGTGLCKVVPTNQVPCWGEGTPRWSPANPMMVYIDGGPFLANTTCLANTAINLPLPIWGSLTWAFDGVRLAAVGEDPPGGGDTDIIVFMLEYTDNGWTATQTANLTDAGPLANAFILDIDWARLSDTLAVTARLPNADTYDIWVLDMNDSTNPRNITNTFNISETEPSWSPLDTQIVYRQNDSIYVMNADGLNVKRIATSANNVRLRAPDWRRNP